MKKTLLIVFLGVLFFWCGHVISFAAETSSQTQIIPNLDLASNDIKGSKITGSRILVLYKERDPDHKGILNILTGLLDKTGYKWDKRDVEKLLMEKEEPDLSPYKGIMTCFQSSQMVGGDVYPYWLVKQMEAGRRILIIGSYGAYQGLIPKSDGTFIEWNESVQTINSFFWPFGLEFRFGWTGEAGKLVVTKKVKDMVEYQAKLKPENVSYYQYYKSVNPKNRIYLELERKDMFDSKSAFVVHTPFGGMILEGYGYFWDSQQNKTLQRVNMVRFMKEAFKGKSPKVAKYQIETHKDLLKKHPLPSNPPLLKTKVHSPGEIKRHVLVLYKKSEAETQAMNPFYNRAEMILNYLGVIVDYHAVEDGLPDGKQMEKYRGIITWHVTPDMPNAKAYGNWLIRQMENNTKVVMIQDYGAGVEQKYQTGVDNVPHVFNALGIQYENLKLARAEYHPEIIKTDKNMIGFERTVEGAYLDYSHKFVSNGSENKVYLSVKDRYNGRIDLVVTTPRGGIAVGNSAFYFPVMDEERIAKIRKALKGELQAEIAEEPTMGSWIVNPFRFFSEALGLDEIPAPDYTTRNGARIYYIHIDGDALNSVSLVDKARLAGELILEEHFRPYQDLPFSASVISKHIETGGNEYYAPLVELTRQIYRLPNVEVATHSSTHPFDWVVGDPYIVNPNEYPWKIDYRPQDYVFEIWGTKLFIEANLAPKGKDCNVLFWSGSCNPDARALKVINATGMKNINGGDPIFDDEHPTLEGLCPLSTKFGEYRQFHTSARNDYIYSLYLTGDWGGQKKVVNHFEKTENPHRIVPMNLYYHFYGGIKRESLDACTFVFKYFQKGQYAGLFASEYLNIAEDFIKTRIWKEKDGIFRIENDGDLRTVRFKSPVFPDMEKSENVIGYQHSQGQTYIHLLGKKRNKIVLNSKPPNSPYLEQGTYEVNDFHHKKGALALSIMGFGKAYFKFGGLRPSIPYAIQIVDVKGNKIVDKDISSDQKGFLNLTKILPSPSTKYQLILSAKGGE